MGDRTGAKRTFRVIVKHPIRWLLIAGLLVAGNAAAQGTCKDCHGDPGFAGQDSTGKPRPLFVTDSTLVTSVHAGLGCADCHGGVAEIPHPEKLPRVECRTCHETEQADVDQSIHHQAGADAPGCADCHGTHDIRAVADSASSVAPAHQAFTCARCHSDPRLVLKYAIPVADPLAAYRNSLHGWLTLTQGKPAATCSSCHGAHRILPSTEAASPVNRQNIAKTCGQCHGTITDEYLQSVHGTAVGKGMTDAPTCPDCHGEHEIQRARAAGAPTSAGRVSAEICGRCHASARLIQKYGLPGERLSTFNESYHGLALRTGNLAVANCASCHGVHNILPSSDPRSTIAPANLEKTCGKCHANVTANFARGKVHLTGEEPPAALDRTVRRIYLLLIVAVIGGMVLHNALDFYRKSRHILKKR